ncbi:MAG: hypothetical protein ACOYOE_03515 [Chlorobium sp.]
MLSEPDFPVEFRQKQLLAFCTLFHDFRNRQKRLCRRSVKKLSLRESRQVDHPDTTSE